MTAAAEYELQRELYDEWSAANGFSGSLDEDVARLRRQGLTAAQLAPVRPPSERRLLAHPRRREHAPRRRGGRRVTGTRAGPDDDGGSEPPEPSHSACITRRVCPGRGLHPYAAESSIREAVPACA